MAKIPRCNRINIVMFDLDNPDNLDKIDTPYHVMVKGGRWDVVSRAMEIMDERMPVKCERPMFRLEVHS